MTEEAWKFLNDQKQERRMYCEDFADKKLSKTMKRKRHEMRQLEETRKLVEEERKIIPSETSEESDLPGHEIDTNFTMEHTEEEARPSSSTAEKRRITSSETASET